MEENQHIEHLAEIRSLMEKSTRFISLSGLSGIMAGVYALAGAFIARDHIVNSESYQAFVEGYNGHYTDPNHSEIWFFVGLGIAVLILALGTGLILTLKKAKQNNQKLLDKVAVRMGVNMAIPLASGGVFCAVLLYNGYIGLVAPATLIFYGLSLINGSKYTLDAIRHLGLLELALGLIAAFDIGNGLFYWSIGFGVLHIVYGTAMWWKHERKKSA
jgi:hypothetical protein